MNEPIQRCSHLRRPSERTHSGRPPLLKVTRALVRASISQGDPRAALRLLGNAAQSVRSLPVAAQRELVQGVLEELRDEVIGFFVGLTPARGRS